MFLAVAPLKAQNTNAEVGTLPGNVDVTPSGGASYSIPLEVPEGVAGMTPSLSFNYNSQAGNGIMGIGWNLAGVQSITRTGQEILYNDKKEGISFDANDEKTRPSDLEIDLVIGKNHQGALLTINDRATGMLKMAKIESKAAAVVETAAVELLKEWKPLLHTITLDRGVFNKYQ